MINYMLRSLEYKNTIFDSNIQQEKINMIIPGVIVLSNVRIIAIHQVKEDEIMRPDLISLKYYNTADSWDLILKFNGISNPFALNTNMLLEIPEYEGLQRFISNTPKLDTAPRKQFTKNNKRLNEPDKKRLEFLKQKSQQKPNGSKENLPPNMLKTGELAKIFKNNKIILGGHLSTIDRSE